MDTTALVDRYFARAAAPDLDAYTALFTPDAVAEDEGHTYRGTAALRAWRADVPPVTCTVVDVAPAGGATRATADVAGDFPGSPVRLAFDLTFRDGLIAHLRIRPVG